MAWVDVHSTVFGNGRRTRFVDVRVFRRGDWGAVAWFREAEATAACWWILAAGGDRDSRWAWGGARLAGPRDEEPGEAGNEATTAVLHSSQCSFGEESWQRGRGRRATRFRAGTVASVASGRVVRRSSSRGLQAKATARRVEGGDAGEKR
ncbi:hypothetical protein CFC21_083305 [Triticum aestivum]|uniref:Uncharacterized protein n=2 Tax=Triticum aestivum TaxID=4565 RepID=A0A3B6NQA5_WHEAT|nr:hypothetical protein CFC21_083305 [Triticum aestivum]